MKCGLADHDVVQNVNKLQISFSIFHKQTKCILSRAYIYIVSLFTKINILSSL